jgi:hypothetical protein
MTKESLRNTAIAETPKKAPKKKHLKNQGLEN